MIGAAGHPYWPSVMKAFVEDRAAGLIWRAKDADNDYVVRATLFDDFTYGELR